MSSSQHYYKNAFDAFRTIYSAEGFRGLIRGVDAAILRTAMGSSVRHDGIQTDLFQTHCF